jgi:hypothetical protein
MAQTLGITCYVIYKFVRFQILFGFSLLCHFRLELAWSLEFNKVGGDISNVNSVKFLGFCSGRMEGTNKVVLDMNWRVFEKKKLGSNWGRFGDCLEAKKNEG